MTNAAVTPSIPAGRLRHPVVIERQAKSFDRSGAVSTWTEFLRTRADIETVRSGDAVSAGQSTAQSNVIITIRYRPGITSEMRVKTATKTYRIEAIENVQERNTVLRLTCLVLSDAGR